MGCIDYSSKFYGMVERQRKRLPLDQFNQWLGDTFADAETILNAIENGDWSKDFTKEVIKEKVTETPRKEYSDEGFFTLQNSDRSTLSFYGSETSEGRIAHNKMVNTFKKNIIKRLIYDYETKSSPNLSDDVNGVSAVNKILFNYKQELMRDIWKVLGVDYSEDYSGDRQFTKQLVKTLSAYEKSLHKKDVMRAYESYVILKNFDNLLKTHVDVVSINRGYDNSSIVSRDMYEYKGPSMKRDASIGKESADANDYTGSIIKLLLDDYFPEVINGQPDPTLKIGLVGFNRVMTHVIEWVENSKNTKLISELNKGYKCDWDIILDAFENDIRGKQGPYVSILKSKLSGIRNYIFNKDANLPYDIINSFNRHVRDVYGQNYSEYVFSRSTSGGNAVHNAITNDYFVDVQLKNVLRIVQSKVDLFRTNSDEFEKFCDRHSVKIKDNRITINQDGIKTHRDEPYTVKVVWDANMKRYQFNREIVRDDVDDVVVADFISDLFDTVVPDDYRDILNSINSSNLFDTFFTAIITTIAAGSNKFDNFKYQWGQQLDTYAYSSDMQSAGKFFAQVYGGETINVVKNKEGNNLPLYSIGSAVRKIKRIIGDVKSALTNAYSSNIFVRKPEILKRVITRSQTDMRSSIKSSKDNSIPEIATVEVIHDFHENLYNNNGVIWMQPICYADKSTHTMFEIDTDSDSIKVDGNVISIREALIQIANGQRSEKLINAIEQRVFTERKSKIKHQVIEMINRFTTVFDYKYSGWTGNFVNYKSTDEQIQKSWNKIREQLKTIESVKSLRSIFKAYNDNHEDTIDLIENYDFGTGIDGNLDVNLMFNDDLNVYLFVSDNKEFKSRLNSARRLTAQDYWEQGLKIMGLDHLSIKERFFTDTNKRWYDPINYEVYPYRVYKPDYKLKTKTLINLTANSSDSKYFTDSDYLVELNPIFESHFLMKLLYGTPMKELMLGSTYAYNSKASFKGDPKNSEDIEKFNSDVRAAKIIEETKRALYCGATTTTYLQGLSYGVPEIANVACVSDLQGLVFNPKGDRDQTDVHDGSGWVSPYWAIQTNESLGDASVGWNKKTIYGHIDNATGVFTEIKWAEFALSNQYRKNSPFNNEFSAERMFEKMHNKPIPDFIFNNIDLQDFYSITSSINSDKKPGILTHQKPVYYFDVNNGNYYEIVSISNEGKDVTVTKYKVDEKGIRIGESITNEEPIVINNLYDLDQLFGGAFCKERDSKSGYLVDSDANNYIVNNIICENDLKDYMVHIVANKSAIKVGQKNLNSDTIFADGNKDALQTFEISTKYGGVIMDADHEIEDSEVREMGQLVSALMQEGNSAAEAKEIYTEIGEVVYENVKTYIDASENIDKTDLYNRLGDALIKAFATQDRDVIGLAQAFISKFEQGDQKYQIPFSSATIAPAFMSAISSVLTKQGIRRTFPGVGAVQVPGRGVMMTYKLGSLNYDIEGATKLAAKQGVTLEQARSLESPFIEQINPDEIDFEDTLIIDGQLVKITDIKSYDYYRNIYKQPVLRHNFQPRDLLAPVPKFSVNGKIYSIYDLDAVRKCNYIGSILSKKVKTSDEDIANFAQIFDNPEEFVSISKNKKELESLLQIYQKEADIVIKTISAIAKIGTGKLPMQKAFDLEGEEVIVDKVFAAPGQIIMGKAYADKLGISKFDNIADIKARGSRFFESQLRSALTMPPESMKNKYDAVAYLNDGTKALIVIGDGISAADKLGETTVDTTFKEINGTIYKNNTEEVCEASDIECRKYTSENGTEYSVFVIRSLDVLDKLNESKMIQMIRYNYRNDNYKQLLLYNHDIEINEDGTFTQPLDVSYPIFDQITHTTTGEYGYIIYDSVQNDLPRILRQDEIAKFVKKVETLANRKYDAFEKSLRFIGTRIPAQSMQSFMPLEVVCFTNSELNDVYVPHTLTWVAGSDYDIDKLYMMGYSLTNSGELFTYSNLADYYNIDDVLKLPEARGRKFSQSVETSTNHITYDELISFINDRNLSPISKVLKNQSDDTRVSFEQGDLDDKTFGIWKRRFIKTLNTHERTRLNPNSRTSALKNRIVSQIETLMLDPINIINMLNPISMDNAKDAAGKTSLGNREKLMNYDVPTSMMIMQYQNMLGKNVIGSAASGLKAYFGELTYFNDIVENIYHQILNNDSPQNVYNNLKRIVFDGKYNSSDIRILGNTPLQKIIDLIQLKPEYKTLVLDDISYNSKMQSHLKDYIEGQSLNFEKLLQKLQETAWQYNTAQNISEVLSAATDFYICR